MLGEGLIRYTPESRWRIRATAAQMRRHEARLDGRVIRFRPGEYRLLEALLLTHPDRALQMNELIERVWPDPADEPDTASWVIKRYLSDLRRLGVPIETKRGFGYRIPEANRGNYTAKRIVSLASPHCFSPHASRSNRGRVWRTHSHPSKVPGVGGDYRNGRDRCLVPAE